MAAPVAGARLALLRIAALSFETLAPLATGEAAARAGALLDLEARLDEEAPRLTEALHAAAGAPTGQGDPQAAAERAAVIAVRRAVHNRRPVGPRDLAALRRRLAPDLHAALAAHLAGRAELAAALAGDDACVHGAELRQARRALLALAEESVFREGIRLVSRSLLGRLRALEPRHGGGAGSARLRHDERHAFAKLTAYAARFTTKSSPNSVFCATAMAWVGGGETRVAGSHRRPRLDVILSIAEARKVSACLGADRAARLEALPHVRPLKGDELFRVDAASGIKVVLPARVRDEIEAPLRRCVRLFAALYPELAFRRAWARRFLTRHPADVDVPLLDLYHGLFEPEPRHRPESFPEAPPGAGAAAELLARTRERFAAGARAALAAGQDEVELTGADWDALLGGLPEPAWSSGVLFQVAARSAGEIAAGRYRAVLNTLFGAGIALARFAHLHGGPGAGNPVAREVERSWQPLARPGAIFAEVTYNHFGRTANAGLRPVLFRHEIELPGSRASPGCEVIALRELTVRWDAAAERFVLLCRRGGVEVIPVLSSGVSPEGFIQFLVEIGRQGLQPLGWFPGFDVPDLRRWPRFTSGRLVLFRRRWQFGAGEAPEAPQPRRESGGADAAAAAFFARTARWRRRHRLPRHVFVHTAAEPKPFYVDLDSPLFVDLLRRRLATPGPLGPSVHPGEPDQPVRPGEPGPAGVAPPALHVTEMLPAPEEMWVRDERGRYATEFLLHLSGPRAGGGD
jgi:Lantibiotic dehydratase, N terminus